MTQPLTRDLVYRILADPTGLDKGARAAERQLATIERRGQMVDRAMTRVGRGMVLVGTAIAGGLVLATKAAVDWESSWAGVLKTVDGTDEQMAALEKEIRALTGILPASHREIAAVAEAAGQLGVQRKDVAAFTKTMIDMGEATDLTADAAATAIARLMNIMQTAPGDVDRLASAIVDLGNKGATTESEITEMALRIAGAARTIGLTEQQVLGFAAALSNVGIRAEAGGTAISKVFLEIDTAVSAGGDNLEIFAETAGMTAEEFRQAYERDAGAAIASFVTGLGRVQETGGDVNAILSDLGITEIRVSDALRRLAGSGDNLTQSLAIGSRAWEENTALTEEAERRYGTVEARLRIARNQMNDFAIDIGQTLLPVLGEMADTVATVAAAIGDLPGPVKTALGIVAAFTAVVLLAGGTALLAVPKIAAFKMALDTIAASGGRGATAVGLFRRSMSAIPWGPLGIALTAATVALGIFAAKQAEARQRIEDISQTLHQQTGAITENTRTWVAHDLEQRGLLEVAQRLGLDLATVTDAVLGDAAAVAELDQVTRENIDTNRRQVRMLGRMGITMDQSTRDADTLRGAVLGLSGDVSESSEAIRRQAEASGEASAELQTLDPQTRAVAETFGVTAGEAEGLTEGIDELDKALRALLGIMFGVEEAEDAAAQALRRVTDAAKDNGASLEGNSEAALRNRDNVRNLISADFDLVAAMAEAGASADDLTGLTERLRKKFIDQMRQAGFSEEAIEEYAAAYDLIPSEVSTRIQTPGLTAAERRLRDLKANIDSIPRRVDIDIHQSIFAPVGSQRVGHQHGGEVFGPGGIDRVPANLTAGEFVIRRSQAQQHKALLQAINSGRLKRQAAAELLRRVRSGGQVFEDLSFRGMSANLRSFNDALADQFYGGGGQFNRRQLEAFLRRAATPPQAVAVNPAAAKAFSHAGRVAVPAAAPAATGRGLVQYTVTTNVTPSRLDFGPRELEAVMAAQEARLRVGRPR